MARKVPPGKELRRLEERLLAEGLEALRRGVDDPALPASVSALTRVRTLSQAHENVQSRRRRLVLTGIVLLVALSALALDSIAIKSVEINGQLKASALRFESAGVQSLNEPLPMQMVVVSGEVGIDSDQSFGLPAIATDVMLLGLSGAITMEPFELVAGDRVRLERRSQRSRYAIALEAQRPISIAFTLPERVRIVHGGQSVEFATASGQPQVSLSWRAKEQPAIEFATAASVFTHALTITTLAPERIEIVGSINQRASSVQGGEIRFSEFERPPLSLFERQWLTFAGLRGRMSPIAVDGDGLALSLTGSATDVATQANADAERRSHIPSVLESLARRSDWTTVWLSAGAVLAFVAAVWPIMSRA